MALDPQSLEMEKNGFRGLSALFFFILFVSTYEILHLSWSLIVNSRELNILY